MHIPPLTLLLLLLLLLLLFLLLLPQFFHPFSPSERRRQEVRLCRRRFRGVEEPSVLCWRRLGPGWKRHLFDDLDNCVIDADEGGEEEGDD